MKLFGLVFIVMITSRPVFSKTIKSPDHSHAMAIKKCADIKNTKSCHEAFEQLYTAHQYQKAYDIGVAGCAVTAKSCESAFSAAQSTNEIKIDSLLKILNRKCDTSANHCDVLATIYKEKKQYKHALETVKKSFNRTGSLQYALLLQELNKDQKLIEKVGYQSCLKNRKNCDRVLRYFSTPTNQEKVAKRVQKECESQASDRVGADYCSVVGTFFFKKGDVQNALKIWSHSCSYNELTCLLILGSGKADGVIEIDAFNSFCKENKISESSAQQLRRKHCLVGVSEVPDEIKDHGKKLLQTFIMQQR